MQVLVKDGRTLTGEFQCLDPQGNLVLANTYERAAAGGEERPTGMALIPAHYRVSVHCMVRTSLVHSKQSRF